MSTARLHGADHRVLGEIASIAEGGAAIALSRGGAPKRYAHADPNEDAAGFAVSGWGALAVIADAHAGHQAARAAVDRVCRRRRSHSRRASPPRPSRWPST
jgi:hypothetical protein